MQKPFRWLGAFGISGALCGVLSCALTCALSVALVASCGTVPKTSLDTWSDGASGFGSALAPLAAPNDSLFAGTLDRCMAQSGAIALPALQADTDLTAYLEQIARVQTDAFNSRSDLLAFWIDAHNAYVLDMLRMNPAHSIDDISGFRYAKVVRVGQDRFSLDDIEHKIIEQQFREPRAFFALFDGTHSSPALASEPYMGDSLSEQLDRQLRGFLADSSKNYVDRRKNTLYLSKIFSEYRSALEEMAGEPLTTIVRDFAPERIAEWLRRHPSTEISYLGYDNTTDLTDFPTSHASKRTYTPPARRSSGGIN